MSLSSLLEAVDDRLNPIVVKELRQAVKSRAVVAILMVFLGLQLVILGFYLVLREVGGETGMVDWNAGAQIFSFQQGILLWTLMLFVPAYAAIRLAAERSDHNVDLLFISTLPPRSIIWGKFFAAIVLSLLVYSTCAPFMTFTYLLRGIDIPTIVAVLVIDLLAMLAATMAALFLASLPGGRVAKFIYCFLGFLFMAWQCTGLTVMTVALIQEGGIGLLEEQMDFPLVAAVTVGGSLAIIGLVFWYTVALISPASSNRMMGIRIYALVLWLGLGAALFLTSLYYRSGVNLWPILAWVIAGTLLACGQFVISICERDHWGPRIARTIPRFLLLRPLAFLFFTGSGGGILLTVGMIVGTLLSASYWSRQFPGTPGEEQVRIAVFLFSALAAYVYCYGMTAVLMRRHLLMDQIHSGFTWLLGLLLVGLGSAIPALIAYLFFRDPLTSGQDGGWWMLGNPFAAMYELIVSAPYRTQNKEFTEVCTWFLGTWVVLVTVLSLPWLVAQMLRFRPFQPKVRELAPVTLIEPTPVPAG